ncbi:hypothetical protein JTB14_007602 [Gonioctena quinquepunctata]|nr:hypothetical protein JTB14_007602 [Gonioctena quinquepunctata]
MNYKIFAIFASISVFQYVRCADERLENCRNKILDHFNNLKSGKSPECFDTSKLQGVTDEFEKFQKAIPSDCKDMSRECFGKLAEFIKQQSSEMTTMLPDLLQKMGQAIAPCISEVKEITTNLDEYIRNGCENPK